MQRYRREKEQDPPSVAYSSTIINIGKKETKENYQGQLSNFFS